MSRGLLERVSQDVTGLFRQSGGMSPMQCLLAGLTLWNGVGTVQPLRLRAADGTVLGSGWFDLNRRVFDVTVGTVAATTGPLALDVPIRVYGPFGSPTAAPAALTEPGRGLEAGSLARLAPGLQAAARQSACAR